MSKLTIFIHGIGSDTSVWNDFINIIKKDDILIEEYKENITSIDSQANYYFLYGYDSKISRIPFWEPIKETALGVRSPGKVSIHEHSQTFTSFIKRNLKKFDEINIVAHSMGGLISMFSIFDLIPNNNHMKIKKVLLYGVPLQGSKDPKKFKKVFSNRIATEVLNELEVNSSTIKELNKKINDKKVKDKISFEYINGDADSRIMKIEEKYIGKYIGKYNSIKGGHSEIIRPKDISSDSFISFKDFILEINDNSSILEDIETVVEEDIETVVEEDIETVVEEDIEEKYKYDFDHFFVDCKTKLINSNFTDNKIIKNYYCDNVVHFRPIRLDATIECDNNSVRVFINLLKQCFNVHTSQSINHELNKETITTINKGDTLYQSDDISNLFINDFYKYPNISVSNYQINQFKKIMDTKNVHEQILNNTIQQGSTIFLTGFIGDGKSALLRKIEMDLSKEESYKVLYIDIEKIFNIESNKETIIKKIFYEFCKILGIANNDRSEISFNNYITLNNNIKFILIIDSLDRIIYNDERFIFLDGFQKFKDKTNLIKGIVENLMAQINNLNASLIFALRPYIASTIFSSRQALQNNALANNTFLYNIKDNSSYEVIKSRCDMFNFLITNAELPETKEICIKKLIRDFQNHFQIFDTNNKKTTKLLKDFYNSSTHGYRTMIEIYQAMSEYPHLLNRFFTHDIMLYFKLDFKKMYSQILPPNDSNICKNRFSNHSGKRFTYPNIFLIVSDNHCNYDDDDCNIEENGFTYWLKYLILLLLQDYKEKDIEPSVQDIVDFFNHEGYNDSIIKLSLGSLGTSNEYNCLKYNFQGIVSDDINSMLNNTNVNIANLGSFLVKDNYCFTFYDLQFVIDDWMLPTIKIDEKYFNKEQIEFLDESISKVITYDYLSDEVDDELSDFIIVKSKQVLFFLHVLEVSFKYEFIKHQNIFNRLKDTITLDDNIFSNVFFDKKRQQVLKDIKIIISKIPDEKQGEIDIEITTFIEKFNSLDFKTSLENIFKDIYECDFPVQCLKYLRDK